MLFLMKSLGRNSIGKILKGFPKEIQKRRKELLDGIYLGFQKKLPEES